MKEDRWYYINNIDEIDTPGLLVYPGRVKKNIEEMVRIAGGPENLRPHVKTYKMTEVVRLQRQAGIKKFKCATIAEAEMLALSGVPDVLLAHQPVGPKIGRLYELTRFYPRTIFSAIVDNTDTIDHISEFFARGHSALDIFIDVDSGNHRTGAEPSAVKDIFAHAWNSPGVSPVGLHVYDGHIRESDPSSRQRHCDEEFKAIPEIAEKIHSQFGVDPQIVAGGTPTFPIHAKRNKVTCSPGTVLFWDWSYDDSFKDLSFNIAAALVTRVISRLSGNLLCLDLGHKAVASENPLNSRVKFPDLPDVSFIGHSEEHLVVNVGDNTGFQVGQAIYGFPFHICPTVALYEKAYVIEENNFTGTWRVIARDRMIRH